MYKKIGLALAFSPRCEAMLTEAYRLKKLFGAELVCIHIGPRGVEEEQFMRDVLNKVGIAEDEVSQVWDEGDPGKLILHHCKKQQIDLLIAGALKKENILKYYIGSIARKIIRRASCSVLMLVSPSTEPKPFKKIVINGTDGVKDLKTIKKGVKLAHLDGAQQTHIFKDIQGYGLSMMLASEETEEEFAETRRSIIQQEIEEIKELLSTIDTFNVPINIKVAGGKEGYQLWKFTRKVKADLLVTRSPGRKLRIFDRIFPHYLEMLMSDLPANLLLDHNKSSWTI